MTVVEKLTLYREKQHSMRNYHHRSSIHRQVVRWRRTYRTFWWVVVGVLLLGLLIGWFVTTYLQDVSPLSQQGNTQKRAYTGPVATVVDNDFFTFESIATWELESSESEPPGVTVYRSRKNGLVIKELTVYYNQTPPETPVTRLIPVTVKTSSLTHANASPRCPVQKVINPKPQREEYAGLAYMCDTAVSGRAIGIAAADGGQIRLVSTSGGTVPVGLLYRDLSGENTPDPMTFYEIIKSFRVK